MDLKQYIDSEADEEQELGYGASSATAATAEGYPGDPDVHVPESSSEIATERTSFQGSAEAVEAYVARPAAEGTAPGIVVIHENKGLVPYIEDVARRLAQQGYVAVAPDLLSRVGGTGAFETPADVTAALGDLADADIVADVRAVLSGMAALDGVDADRLGILGFCYGGGVAWRVLTQEPRLVAGVPFYGPIPPLEAVPDISAAVLGIYGELDQRITSMLPDIEQAMASAGKSFDKLVLADAQHAFHNDTNPDRYNPTAAEKAWTEAVTWLDSRLKG